jgi:hypothetical protein
MRRSPRQGKLSVCLARSVHRERGRVRTVQHYQSHPWRLVWYARLHMTKCLMESSNRRDVDSVPTM